MYNSQDVATKIKELSKSKNITVKQLLEDVGLGFNTMSHMRTSMPKADNLAKIADYLDVSVDYLLGRTDNFHSSDKEQSENNLSSDEQKLIDIYNSLSDDDKILLMAYGLQLQRNMPILNVVNKPTKQDTEEELRVVARGEGLTTIKANASDIDDDIKRHIHKDKI